MFKKEPLTIATIEAERSPSKNGEHNSEDSSTIDLA